MQHPGRVCEKSEILIMSYDSRNKSLMALFWRFGRSLVDIINRKFLYFSVQLFSRTI